MSRRVSIYYHNIRHDFLYGWDILHMGKWHERNCQLIILQGCQRQRHYMQTVRPPYLLVHRWCCSRDASPGKKAPYIENWHKTCMQDNTSAPWGLIIPGGMLAGLCVHQLPATLWAGLSPSHIQHGGGGSVWVLQQHGVWAVIHYVDEFLLLGTHVHSTECQQALATTLASCEELGVPDKTEGPNTTITFLGIQLDSSTMSMPLPATNCTSCTPWWMHWPAQRL